MTVREGRWDCQYCGATGILGRDKSCNSCGRSRPEGTKFYLPGNEPEVTKEALLKQARLGPDWVCEFCSSSNAVDRTTCHSCNAARGTSPSQEVKDHALGETPRSGDMDMSTPPPRPTSTVAKKKTTTPWQWIAGGCGVVALIALLCFCGMMIMSSFSSELEATVTQLDWQRTVEVEAFQTVTEEDWSIPNGGRLLSQWEDIHHYDQVLERYETRERQVSEQVKVGDRTYVCGQRDLGNGFFEDIECQEPIYETQYHTETYQEPIYLDVPVYQTKYSYEIDKWQRVRSEEASGDRSPHWPEFNLASNEREGNRSEKYSIQLLDTKGRTHTLDLSLEEWLRYEVGATYKIKVSGLGQLTEIIH